MNKNTRCKTKTKRKHCLESFLKPSFFFIPYYLGSAKSKAVHCIELQAKKKTREQKRGRSLGEKLLQLCSLDLDLSPSFSFFLRFFFFSFSFFSLFSFFPFFLLSFFALLFFFIIFFFFSAFLFLRRRLSSSSLEEEDEESLSLLLLLLLLSLSLSLELPRLRSLSLAAAAAAATAAVVALAPTSRWWRSAAAAAAAAEEAFFWPGAAAPSTTGTTAQELVTASRLRHCFARCPTWPQTRHPPREGSATLPANMSRR